jgi:hypothetical protein
MKSAPLVDCAGRRRSPATLPGYHRGRPPRNKGLRYPPDAPTVEEIIAVMRAVGDEAGGVRLRGVIVVLWRAGLPIGALFCVPRGPTRGRPCSAAGVRVQLRNAAVTAGVRRRLAPHQFRHAHAVEMSREGVLMVVIQRQLGHADLGVTSVYLRGIDNTEIVHAVHERPAPMIPAGNGLRLTH